MGGWGSPSCRQVDPRSQRIAPRGAQTTTSSPVKNKYRVESATAPNSAPAVDLRFVGSSINAGVAIKRREVSKVAGADAGHLAPSVWDDSTSQD